MINLLQLTPYTSTAVTLSPNHSARRAPAIEGIVLHATADAGNEAGTLSWMQSPKSGVSCHLLVSRRGDVTRLVGDQRRAWHAGLSWWRGTSDVNSITLGIEIANRNDGEPYSNAQYRRVAEIVAHYSRQGLSLDDVVSHQEIAKDGTTDPLGWDWDRFRAMVQERLRMDIPRHAVSPRPPLSQVPARPTQRIPVLIKPKAKPAVRSRTLWFNTLMVFAAGSVIISDILELAYSVGLTVPEKMMMWVLFGVGLVNIALRYRTDCPIGSGESGDHLPQGTTMRR